MAVRLTGRKKVVVSSDVDFTFRRTLRTYARGADLEIVDVPTDRLASSADGTVCFIVQHRDAFGTVVDVRAIADGGHEVGALCIQVTEPHALALLEPPGALGVDIAVGEGQPLGIPMSYGGPHLGIFACRGALVRQMPGRIAGQTVDADGVRGFVNTLQTREQHIRREKATSNICTNEALAAIHAAVYVSLLGPEGLRAAARAGVACARALANRIAALPTCRIANDRAFFHRFPARTDMGGWDLRRPERDEPQVVRHSAPLAGIHCSVDGGMYPLGSCTMKYNPKTNDRTAWLFADLPPRQSYRTIQGVLALASALEEMFVKIAGM